MTDTPSADPQKTAGSPAAPPATPPGALSEAMSGPASSGLARRGALEDIARFFRRLQWALLFVAVGALIWVLTPVLTPFATALLLAWLGDPVVARLQARGMSRNSAVVLVFSAMLAFAVAVVLVLIPLVSSQVQTLAESFPRYLQWLSGTAVPWLEGRTGMEVSSWLDPQYVLEQLRRHWESASGFAGDAIGYLTRSGFAVLGWVANLVLIPFLTFFFLRDWHLLVERARALIPPRRAVLVATLARESDEVLGSFLRGQFMVMLSMGLFYAAGLWLVGIDVGVLIGVAGGLLTFIPYVGPTTVLVGGVVAALVQFGDWPHLAGVLAVWGLGQLLESYVLTPKLVGDRVGLSPVTVVFAVMVGGSLFGFLGMLLALPVASVANVLLRHLHRGYLDSDFYRGGAAPAAAVGDSPGAEPPRA